MSLFPIVFDLIFIGFFIYFLVVTIHHFNYDLWLVRDRNILAVFDISTLVFYMLMMFFHNSYLTIIFAVAFVYMLFNSRKYILKCNQRATKAADKELRRLESQDRHELHNLRG